MIPGYTTLSEVALTEEPSAIQSWVADQFSSIGEDDALIYLLEAEPYDAGSESAALGLPPPAGAVPTTAWDGYTQKGGSRTIRLSDRGYTTGPSDTPANTPYSPRLGDPFNVGLALGGGAAFLSGGGGRRGQIRIDDWNGLATDLSALNWANRPFEILAGKAGFTRDQFGTVMKGRVSDGAWKEGAFILGILDPKDRLSVPLTLPVYAGTGGAEGGADLTGQNKPFAGGPVIQAPGTPVNVGLNIFQWSFRAIQGFDAIRVRGSDVTASGTDHATYAALAAATIAGGEYDTCLALGMARLGTDPDGVVTADVLGDAVGSYINTAGALARRIVTTFLPAALRLADPDEIEAVSFSRIDTDEPGKAFVWIPTGSSVPTAREVVDRLLGGIGAWWDFNALSQMFVQLIGTPVKPEYPITRAEMTESGLEALQAAAPAREVRVAYNQRQEVVTKENIAAGLSDEDQALYTQAFSFPTPYKSPTAKARQLDAGSITIESPLIEEAAAVRLQDRLGPYLDKRPRPFRVPLRRGRFRYRVGQVVSIQDARAGVPDATPAWVTNWARQPSTGTLALTVLAAPAVRSSSNLTEVILTANPWYARIEAYSNSTYEIAREGLGNIPVNRSETTCSAGQWFSGNYRCFQFLFSFPQPDARKPIIDPVLELAPAIDFTVTDFLSEVRLLEHIDDPDASDSTWSNDYTPGSELGDLPLLATYDSADGVPIGSYVSFTDGDLALHMARASNIRVMISSKEQRIDSAPTTFEWIRWYSPLAAASLVPRIRYTTIR